MLGLRPFVLERQPAVHPAGMLARLKRTEREVATRPAGRGHGAASRIVSPEKFECAGVLASHAAKLAMRMTKPADRSGQISELR